MYFQNEDTVKRERLKIKQRKEGREKPRTKAWYLEHWKTSLKEQKVMREV